MVRHIKDHSISLMLHIISKHLRDRIITHIPPMHIMLFSNRFYCMFYCPFDKCSHTVPATQFVLSDRYRSDAPALSIFRASQFGTATDLLRMLTTISCGVSWASAFGTLTGRLVHPTAPVLVHLSLAPSTPHSSSMSEATTLMNEHQRGLNQVPFASQVNA